MYNFTAPLSTLLQYHTSSEKSFCVLLNGPLWQEEMRSMRCVNSGGERSLYYEDFRGRLLVDTDPVKPMRGTCKHCASTRALIGWCCHSYRLSQKTHISPPLFIIHSFFSWAKDLFTQVRITNCQFLGFCFYKDRSWWIKHCKRMYNTIKLCFGALLKKEVLCAIKYTDNIYKSEGGFLQHGSKQDFFF